MQFISMDTYDLANRYGYCDGNPIGNVDPSGHMSGLSNFFVQFTAGGLSSELGEIVGGGLGQLICFGLDEGAYAVTDLLCCKNTNEFIQDTKFNAIGNAIGGLHLILRFMRMSSKGNILYGYLGRRAEKKELENAFTIAGINRWEGKCILDYTKAKRIYDTAEKTNNAVCFHITMLAGLSDIGTSRKVSFDEILNLMRKGFNTKSGRGVMSVLDWKQYFGKNLLSWERPADKNIRLFDFLKDKPAQSKFLVWHPAHFSYAYKDENGKTLSVSGESNIVALIKGGWEDQEIIRYLKIN